MSDLIRSAILSPTSNGLRTTHLNFNGSTSYITCGNSATLRASGSISGEAWIKPAVVGADFTARTIFAKGPEYLFRTFDYLGQSYIVSYFYIDGSYEPGLALFSNPIPINQWTHVAFTWNSSSLSNNHKVYINGELVGQQTRTGSIASTADALTIGNWFESGDYWSGSIDEVRIWNTERTADQIKRYYNTQLRGVETGLAGYWSMNNGVGGIIDDLSNNTNTGSFRGATPPFWTPTQYSVDFNGTTSYINLQTGSILNTQYGTIECWAKSDNPTGGTNQHLINRRNTNVGTFALTKAAANVWNANVRLGAAPGTSINVSAVTATTNWTHLAATYDGTLIRLYVNGELQQSGSAAGVLDTASFTAYNIGRNTSAVAYFDGKIDEVRIWNYARTATEIRRDYTRQMIGNEPGLVAYYRLNEGTGTNASDSSGNNNTGSIISSTWATY